MMHNSAGLDAQVDESHSKPWLSGVIPPIVSPMSSPGTVDAAALVRQCRRLLDAGVHGIFVLGTSGEGAYLPARERRRVVDIVATEVAGEVPVLVGALQPSPDLVAEALHDLRHLHFTGAVVCGPCYGARHPAEVAHHLESIARFAGDLPLVAYDIPAAAGSSLTLESLMPLADRGAIQAFKDSSGDDVRLRRAIAAFAHAPDFSVLTGSELTVDTALQLGAAGAVPGLANVFPKAYVAIFDLIRTGHVDHAIAVQSALIDIYVALRDISMPRTGPFSAGIGAFKSALVALGVIGDPSVSAPLTSLTHVEHQEVLDVVRHAPDFDEMLTSMRS